LLSWRLLVLIACLPFFHSGCAGHLAGLEPANLPTAPIVERLQERRGQLFSFRGVGTLRLEGGKKRWFGNAFLLARSPQSLRLEMISPLGQPLLYIASDGRRFVSWVPGQREAYRGTAPGNTLATLINFPLNDQEALMLLAGLVPEFGYKDIHLLRDPKTGKLLLSMEDSPTGRAQRVWLEADGSTVSRIERLQGSRRELEAWFTDFSTEHGFCYPEEVRIEVSGLLLAIHYQQFAINVALDDNAFRLDLPAGVEVIPW
jgi:outer membrane lipoprotein-sorting protein